MTTSPSRQLDARIRIASHAAEDAEGVWMTARTPEARATLNVCRAELTDLVAERRRENIRQQYASILARSSR